MLELSEKGFKACMTKMHQSAIMNMLGTNEKWGAWEKKYKIPEKTDRKEKKEWKERKEKKTNGNFITEKHVKPKYQYQWIGSTGRWRVE